MTYFIHDIEVCFYNTLITLFQHAVDNSSIVLDCQRLWRSPEFSFHLTWTLPTYLSHGDAISWFIVNIELRNTSKNPPDSLPIIIDDIYYPSVHIIYNFNSFIVFIITILFMCKRMETPHIQRYCTQIIKI